MSIQVINCYLTSSGGGGSDDPYFKNVVLLIGANGTNGSTSFTDESNSAHTITANGNAQISTAQSKFGGSSILLDGTGDYLDCSQSDDWNMRVVNFTFEMWMRASSLPSIGHLFGQGGFGNAFRGRVDSDGSVKFSLMGAGSTSNSAAGLVSTGQWYHVCFERYQTKERVYLDGVMVASRTGITDDSSTSYATHTTNSLKIGGIYDGTQPWNGYIDEVRFTYGIARYNDDAGFTPPTAAFPRTQETETGTYRFYKFKFNTANNANGDILFREINVAESNGGTDISQCAKLSGSAGFYSSAEGVWRSANNNTADWWQPRISGGVAVEIVYDFLIKRTLTEVILSPNPSYLTRTPQDVEVLGSNDGSSYTSIQTWTGFSSWSGDRTLNW